MANNDQIQRFLFDETDIRGEVCSLETAFKEAYAHQNFPIALTPLFGEFLAGAALLSEVLKFEGILTLQARGDGPVALIMAESNHRGEVRGIVRMREDHENTQTFDSMDLHTLMGEGLMTITIDPDKGKRYQGVVPIQAPKLAEALQGYFEQSEQLPTQIQLFANNDACGGLFLQCLPAQLVPDEEQRQEIWQTATHLASTITEDELFSLESESLLTRLFHEMKCRVFTAKELKFYCSCSRERSANALQSLGYDDALALLQERKIIKIDCQFCGKMYEFDEASLKEVFPGDTGGNVH